MGCGSSKPGGTVSTADDDNKASQREKGTLDEGVSVHKGDILKNSPPVKFQNRRGSSVGMGLAEFYESEETKTREKIPYEQLKKKSLLGTGNYARVHLVADEKTGTVYALKIMSKGLVSQMQQVDHVKSERWVLENCKHPLILQLVQCYQDSLDLHLMLEAVMGGDLFRCMRLNPLTPEQTMFYAANGARHLLELASSMCTSPTRPSIKRSDPAAVS